MSETCPGETAGDALRHENGLWLGVAGWLGLAAAPTFAVMALLTAVGGGPSELLCSAGPAATPLTGMTTMYLLMSVFHSAPWLKLISSRRMGPRT